MSDDGDSDDESCMSLYSDGDADGDKDYLQHEAGSSGGGGRGKQ